MVYKHYLSVFACLERNEHFTTTIKIMYHTNCVIANNIKFFINNDFNKYIK